MSGAVEGGAEAILVPDTAMPSLHLIERLEGVAGRPVLTANAVTLWQAIRLARGSLPIARLRRPLAGAEAEEVSGPP